MAEGYQLHIEVYEQGPGRQDTVDVKETFRGPVELGRQQTNREAVFKKSDNGGGLWRLAIAKLGEDVISRRHALIEPLPDERIRIKNLSTAAPIRWHDDAELRPGEETVVSSPTMILLGSKKIGLTCVEDDPGVVAMTEVTRPPGSSLNLGFATLKPMRPILPSSADEDLRDIIDRLQLAMNVIQGDPTSLDYFSNVAKAVVSIVNLDSARVLGYEQGSWPTKAVQGVPGVRIDQEWQPSRSVLHKLMIEKRTFIKDPSQSSDSGSLVNLDRVVAAPILNAEGDVIGALYGERKRVQRAGLPQPITALEAKLVELMAMGIANGLDRMDLQVKAAKNQAMLEGFFTQEIAREVSADLDKFLRGSMRDISVLFCDIRGFSSESGHIGPAKTMEWIQHVMGELSQCVLDQQGTVVDFVGDELIAMWGAPRDQPDHALLACQAGLNMLKRLPGLTEKWKGVLRKPMAVGIGINSGAVMVGNTGTQHKMKYGPLGDPVNLASRVQSATKHVKVPYLITNATQQRVGSGLAVRKVGQFKLRNILEPATLYEPSTGDQPNWKNLCVEYEDALGLYEKKQFKPATRILSKLMADFPDDGPTMFLLSNAVKHMVEESDLFNPVFDI